MFKYFIKLFSLKINYIKILVLVPIHIMMHTLHCGLQFPLCWQVLDHLHSHPLSIVDWIEWSLKSVYWWHLEKLQLKR